MTTTSLDRVPLTLAAALAFHVSMSPPSTRTPDDGRVVCTTARLVTAVLTKGLFWASAITDTVVALAPHVPASLPSPHTLLSHLTPPTPTQWGPSLAMLRTSLSLVPAFVSTLPLVAVAGTTLALAGAYMRYAAYRALGQFYACPNRGPGPCVPRGTSGTSAQADGHAHALITTGPYAFVRHPGYAGLVLCTTGLVVFELDQICSSGGLGLVRVTDWMRTVAIACAVVITVRALRRVGDEERSLRARFKGEWERWADEVPSRFVPGVY